MNVGKVLMILCAELEDQIYWCENHDASSALQRTKWAIEGTLRGMGYHQDQDGTWVEPTE